MTDNLHCSEHGWQVQVKHEGVFVCSACLQERANGLLRTDPPMPAGRKDDQGKPRLDLIPFEPLVQVGEVLAFGAAKYGERNWEQGLAYGRLYGAGLRHITAWWGGEELDDESGLPHLAHALCCLLMLTATHGYGRPELDDRATPTRKAITT